MPPSNIHKKKLKTNLAILATIIGFCALIWAITMVKMANAAENKVVHCGVPDGFDVTTNPGFEFCDIYSRQLAYREERLKLRKQLEQRQTNFVDPQLEAYKNYKKELEALHNRTTESPDEAR